jgi:hypothetical protein
MTEPTTSTTRQPAPAQGQAMRPQAAANAHDSQPAHPLADLHRALGNIGVVQRMADPTVMPKLEVGAPDDRHEREADQVASAIMRQPDDIPNVSAAGAQISREPEDHKEPPTGAKPGANKPPPKPAQAPAPPPKAGATKKAPAAAPGKGKPEATAGHGAHKPEPDKKAPGAAAVKGHDGPGKARGEHGKNPVTGKAPAHSPVAAKGKASHHHEHEAAAKQAAKHPAKHPDAKAPHGAKKAMAPHAHKPSPGPKTGKTGHDHAPGHPKPSAKHTGGPPKHIHQKPTQAAAPTTATSQTPTTQTPAQAQAQAPAAEHTPDDLVVAAKPAAPGVVPTVTPAAARTISSSQGSGQPLSTPDRGFFESRLGRDLGGVRVHNNPAAHQAAKDVRAKAFTYGQDVYFSSGRYQPGTGSGRELLAHELAHTIQQRPGAKLEHSIQRQPDGGGSGSGGAVADPLPVGNIGVPAFRLTSPNNPYTGKLTRSSKYTTDTRPNDQRDLWKADLGPSLTGQVKTLIDSFTRRNYNPQSGDSGSPVVLKTNAAGSGRFITGSQQDMASELATPDWDSAGGTAIGPKAGFQVDHILELQLSGYPDTDVGHKPGNMQLLRASVNTSSGSLVNAGAVKAVLDYLKTLPPAQFSDPASKLMDPASKAGGAPADADANFTMRQHNIQFAGATAAGGPAAGATDIWTHADIAAGKHLGITIGKDNKPAVEATTMASVGDKGSVAILPSASGGLPKKLSTNAAVGDESKGFKPYKLVNKSFNIGDDWRSQPMLGTLALEIPADHKTFTQATALLQVERYPGAQFAGHLQGRAGRGGSAAINDQMRGLGLKRASPIEITDSGLGDQGFELNGKVKTDLPLLSGATMDLAVTGDNVSLSHTFQGGEIHVPAPLKVTDSSLTLKLSSGTGLSASGRVEGEIEKLGKGFLEADADTTDGLSLKGGFDFQSQIFQQARVNFAYAKDKFSADGTLAIGSGKVAGVKSASLKVSYADDHFDATGSATLDIPGVDSADLSLSYDAASGMTLTASPKLKPMPGLKSGDLSITIQEPPGGSAKLSGHGTAVPDIPGVDAQLTVSYDDGAFLAQVTTAFAVGRLQGTITAGATNQPLKDDGTPGPAGGGTTGNVAMFGSGSATIKLTDSLSGTAGFRLLPNGEVEVHGELAVSQQLWPGKDLVDRDLIPPISVTVPIFPPVDLHVAAGLKLKIGYGAGQLSGSVGITYNPSHEDEAKVDGKLHLHASAYAGIELATQVGLGLGVTGASVSGNIDLGGELRIDANLDDDSHATWSPDAGLVVDNTVTATVSPSFVIHLGASVDAELGPLDFTLWHENFADFPFGSGLQVGLSWPVHYESNKPFEPSFDDIKLNPPKPDVSPDQLAKQILQEKAPAS